MATTVSYIIKLTDPVLVAQLQAQFPAGVFSPPGIAGPLWNAPIGGHTPGGAETNPGTYIYPSDALGFAIDLSPFYSTESFTAVFNGQPPPPGPWPNPYPISIACTWAGFFVYAGANTGVPVGQPRYTGQRRWIDGFEVPSFGEGGGGQGLHSSRDASRTVDGLGFAYRANSNDGKLHLTAASPGPWPYQSWERFYIRLRTLPSGSDDNIWGAKGATSAGTALLCNVSTTGTLKFYDKGNAAYPGVLLGSTSPLALNVWYRVDLYIAFPSNGLMSATLGVYINGTQVLDIFETQTGSGFASVQQHQSSTIGSDASATSHGLEADFDDWINAAPVNIFSTAYPGLDLLSGSHVQLVRPTGFDPSTSPGWTGDWRLLNAIGSGAGVVSTAPGAILAVTTDYTLQQLGCVAINVGTVALLSPGAGPGAIGRAGSTLVPAVFTTGTWASMVPPFSQYSTVFNLLDVRNLPPISSVSLTVQASSSAGTSSFSALFGVAEFLGQFGVEDSNPASPVSGVPFPGLHNAPYPSLAAAQTPTPTIQAVRAAAGIYIGNNIGQDIFEKIPAHWWWVRPLSGSNDGVIWYSTMVGAHGQVNEAIKSDFMPQAKLVAGVPNMQTSGSLAQANANAVSYQWIAISDVGHRVMLNGAFSHATGLASAVNALSDPSFLPNAVFLFLENYGGSTSTHYYKGSGHAGVTASLLNAAVSASIASLAAGSITSKIAIHTDVPQTTYSAWRTADGSGMCSGVVAIGSYVGNGGASQIIPLALNGSSPLFALVVPHDAGSWFRDPSHTGVTSSPVGGAPTTGGITGGDVNAMTIGTSLNTNLTVYDYFAIGGEIAPGSWSPNTNDLLGNIVPITLCGEVPPPTPVLGALSGTVTALIGGAPIANVPIIVYAVTGAAAGNAVTDGSGNYTVSGLPAGVYFARTANTGGYTDELYNQITWVGQSVITGSPIAVVNGATTPSINFVLAVSGGSISGTVTDVVTAAGLAGVVVDILTATGALLTTATTAANGTYSVGGVPVGSYFAVTANALQFGYNNQLYALMPFVSGGNPLLGTPVVVVNATNTPNVNFALVSSGGGCIAFGEAVYELSVRLNDVSFVHWTNFELQLYLLESLRVYNALTMTAKGRGTFTTSAAVPFYDLPTKLPALRGYNLTDQILVQMLEYHLIEPPTPTAWTGTAMFSLVALTQALQRRLELFLWETGMVVTRETKSVTPDANGRVALPLDVISVRRAAWTNSTPITSPLLRDDEWSMNGYARTWPTPVVASAVDPVAYSVGVTPPLVVKLAPPPTVIGTLDTLSVVRGAILNPVAGVLLGIPDDFAWVVKFGALSDLLSASGPAQDPARAALCAQMWDQGVKAAQATGVVLDVRVGGVIARVNSMSDADFYSRNWQNTPGVPTDALLSGNNLMGLSPVPDVNGPYTVAVNVVCNQPVPTLLTDCFFEGGAFLTQALLDYAQFLSLFKEGPEQAQSATALLQRFFSACGIAVQIDQAQIAGRGPLLKQTAQDERVVPRAQPPDETVH